MTTLEIAGLCTGIATVTAALTTAIIRIIDKRNSQTNLVRASTRDEFVLLFNRQDARIAHLEKENQRYQNSYARALQRIGSLESACRAAGINVEDWSGDHEALTEEQTRQATERKKEGGK